MQCNLVSARKKACCCLPDLARRICINGRRIVVAAPRFSCLVESSARIIINDGGLQVSVVVGRCPKSTFGEAGSRIQFSRD